MATSLTVLNYCLSREITVNVPININGKSNKKNTSIAEKMAGPGAPENMSAACWPSKKGNDNKCKQKTIDALKSAISTKKSDIILLQNNLDKTDYESGIGNTLNSFHSNIFVEGAKGPNVGWSDVVTTYYKKTTFKSYDALPSFYYDSNEVLILFVLLERGDEKFMVVNVSSKQVNVINTTLQQYLDSSEIKMVDTKAALDDTQKLALKTFMSNSKTRIVMGGNMGKVNQGDQINLMFDNYFSPVNYDSSKWKKTSNNNTYNLTIPIPNINNQTWNTAKGSPPGERWTAILGYPASAIVNEEVIDTDSGTSRYLPVYAKIIFETPPAAAPTASPVAPPTAPPAVAPVVAVPETSTVEEDIKTITKIAIEAPLEGVVELTRDNLTASTQAYGTGIDEDIQNLTEAINRLSTEPDSIEKIYAIEKAITEYLAERVKYIDPLSPAKIRLFVASKAEFIIESIKILEKDTKLYRMIDDAVYNLMEERNSGVSPDPLSLAYINLLTRMGVNEEIAVFLAYYYRALRDVTISIYRS
jgi:hypothetical protein